MTDIKGTQVLQKLNGVEKKPATLKEFLASKEVQAKIVAALPKLVNPDAFMMNAYNIWTTDSKLQQCTVKSFLQALMDAAKVGQMPNSPLKHCDIIPYRDKGVMTAHFQMEYRGHVDLALRTGMYSSIYAHEVYPQDEFSACYGLNKDLIHIPSTDPIPTGTLPTYYYAVYKLKNGGFDFVYWTRDRVLKHRDTKSKSYIAAKKGGYAKDNIWVTDEIAMGKKTMIIQVLNTAPKSIEMVRALSTEEEGEYLKKYFKKDEDIFENVPGAVIEEAEVEEEPELRKEEPKLKKEKPATVNKQTGEVVNDITAKEKEEIEKAVNKGEETTLFKEKKDKVSRGEDFVGH